jgi:hypothetical protein
LGQLLAHVGFLAEMHLQKGLGDIEDDELIAILYRHREELLARLELETQQAPTGSGGASISGSSIQPETAQA